MRTWWWKLRAIGRRHTLDDELRMELDAHLQMEIEAARDRGVPPREAIEMARRQLGNRALIHERSRDAWAFYWFETLLQDLRVAVRSLRRTPAFSVVAIGILAIGIGGSTAVFGVVNAVMLKPLPFRDPDRIVALRSLWKKTNEHGQVSLPDFNDWHAQSASFDAMAYYITGQNVITAHSDAQFATVSLVSSEFFSIFGVEPAKGHLFQHEDTTPGSAGAAVVSHAFWLTNLGGDPSVLGTSIRIAGHSMPIIAIMPAAFQFPEPTEIWIPADTVFRIASPNRGGHNMLGIGTLKTTVSLDNARAEMTQIGDRLERQYPGTNGDKNVSVTPLAQEMTRDSTTMLYVLLGAVLLLLLIACGNVANLLLAKAVARTREIGLRAALGAGRARIVRQLITESLALGIVSGLAGLVLATFLTSALVALAPAGVPRLQNAGIDRTVLTFATMLTLAACVLFGLVPAVRASQIDVHQALKQAGTRGPAGIGSSVRLALVIGEIALSVVLLTGAGLLIRSFAALTHVTLGFDTQQILVMQTSNPVTVADIAGAERVVRMYQTLLDEIARMPEITTVAASRVPPGRVLSSGVYAVDQAAASGKLSAQDPQAVYSIVSPNAFAVLGIPLRSGRDFSAADGPAAPRTAIINETLARKAFPDRDPLGHVILTGLDSLEPMTIVGVVGDIRQRGPGDEGLAEVYMPYPQHPRPSTAMSILARTTMTPGSAIEPLRRMAKQVAPEMPVKFTTMEARVSEDIAVPRFRTLLLAIFSAIALVLTITGVYGVVSFLINQRTQEIGVRMALGASTSQVVRMILRQGVWMAAIGLVVGLAGAAGMTRFLASMLFEVRPFDPATYVVVGGVIGLITISACVLPARRALRIDPAIALRHE